MLPEKGKFRATLKTVEENIYVISKLKTPLVGIKALNLVSRVQSVNSPLDTVKEFPRLFEGLRKTLGEYSISLENGAKPYATNVSRRVATPLMPKVKAELRQLGVILPINDLSRYGGGGSNGQDLCGPDWFECAESNVSFQLSTRC